MDASGLNNALAIHPFRIFVINTKRKDRPMTTKTENQQNTPAFNIHASVPDGRNNRVGSKIGVAFKHKKGNGLTILLDASPIPVNGRIELVAFEPKPQS